MPLGTHGSSTNYKFLSVFFFPSDFDFSLPGGIAFILPTGQKDYLTHVHCLRSDSANFFASTLWPCT